MYTPPLVAWVLLNLLRIALLEPVGSSMMGAAMLGEPELGIELVSICRRESRCRPIGAHAVDAWAGPLMHRKAMKVGWLDESCPFHHGRAERFSTRGIYGLSAAYTLRFLGGCLPPEVLDVPLVSAFAATLRSKHMCKKHGACTREGRRRQWAGARRYDRRQKG
jgi:hypothetical protein